MQIHAYSNVYNRVKEKRSSFGYLIADENNEKLKSGRYHLSDDYNKNQAWYLSIKYLMMSIKNPSEVEFVLHSTHNIVTDLFKLTEDGNWQNNYKSNGDLIEEIREMTTLFKDFFIVEDLNSTHGEECKSMAKSV